jgi:Leucine rich repeat
VRGGWGQRCVYIFATSRPPAGETVGFKAGHIVHLEDLNSISHSLPSLTCFTFVLLVNKYKCNDLTMMVPLRLTTSLIVALGLLPQPSQATGLKRLRKTALRVPDLNPIVSSKQKTEEDQVAGFELMPIQDELEELLLNEVFRLDASMSMSLEYNGGSSSDSSGVSGTIVPVDSHSSGVGGTTVPVNSDSSGVSGTAVPVDSGSIGVSGTSVPVDGDGSAVYLKCGMTMAERSAKILDILSKTSLPTLLTDMSSTRYKARYWLDEEDTAMICPSDEAKVLQRYSVALMYFQFGGDNWNNCRADGGTCFQEDSTSVPAIPFLDKSNECLWFGLSCDNVPRDALPSESNVVSADEYMPIISVDISDNALTGDLFPELFGLTGLQELTLDGNKGISGSIPDAVGQLTNLMALDLDDNAIVGTLPDSLYTLTNLEAIDLNLNSLSGAISDAIGDLTKLVVLQLDDNELTGKMPTDALLRLEALGKFDHSGKCLVLALSCMYANPVALSAFCQLYGPSLTMV